MMLPRTVRSQFKQFPWLSILGKSFTQVTIEGNSMLMSKEMCGANLPQIATWTGEA
uniref:Uncharacterized protein n=1 Tax=Arundo donax TaxID=35708 RepID=A0A0A9HQ56_ARUDO